MRHPAPRFRRPAGRLLATLLLGLAAAPLAAADLDFDSLYLPGVLGLTFSPQTLSFKNRQTSIVGYMAPPLRLQGKFFVLTRQPVSLCPFCNSDADWPADIIVVYLTKDEFFTPHGRPLLVVGKLEIGSYRDPDTGFVSQLRLVDARYTEE